MKKIKFGRFIPAVIFSLSLVIMCSGCGNSRTVKNAYNFYNKVQLGQSKDDVDKSLKVTPKEKNSGFIYLDKDTGYGVTVYYDSDNLVKTKAMYNADNTKIFKLSDATVTEDQVASISEGMTYDEVKTILGSEGKETITTVNPEDANNPISMMIWFNDDGTGIYITFNGYEGTVRDVKYWK
ncbi:hypothetical protein [Acetobacterium tundrae]|uniref:DUF3862 domain-containing protein n=1 Tax=Acetobacterium tundrae TaxID=132932 RepID=A0ABR6WK27_9FIRM|nr:hypothetical protein [Acetobacterium tundrae]MBC3796633.1 hypothetical protein [Acetobacterium tundrae]